MRKYVVVRDRMTQMFPTEKWQQEVLEDFRTLDEARDRKEELEGEMDQKNDYLYYYVFKRLDGEELYEA